MLEAKGPGYADKMIGSNEWSEWYIGVGSIKTQMRNQSDAAAGRKVQWHFAEPESAQYFRKYAEDKELMNVQVIYTPPK